jgi:RHS repeat-associated protein
VVDPTNVANGTTCPSTPPTTPPTGTTTGYKTTIYDSAGRTTSTTDQAGDTTSYTYDGDANKLTSTDPAGQATNYCYYWEDGTGQCAASAPTAGGAGNMLYSTTTPVTAADPAGETTTDSYWPGGAAHVVTNPAGSTTTTPDAAGDTTSVAYVATGSYVQPTNVSYTYYADQTRKTMADGTGTTTYTYDDDSRVLGQSFVAKSGTGLANKAIGYTYEPSGEPATVVYPSYSGVTNPTATYTYNAAGETASVTDWMSNEITFSYDADGNQTSQDNDVSSSYPSGNSNDLYSYDAADLNTQVAFESQDYTGDAPSSLSSSTPALASIAGAEHATSGAATPSGCTWNGPVITDSFTVTPRNADGQLTEADQIIANCGSSTPLTASSFGYDAAGRVNSQGEQVEGTWSYTSFGYTGGNPTTLYGQTQTFDNAGEVTTSGSSSYAYDTLGDRISGPNTTYTYNMLGEMASENSATYYRYNGDGLQAEEGPNTTTATAQLIWDTSTASEPELLSDGINYYIYGPSRTPVEQYDPGYNGPTTNPEFINFSPTDSFYDYTNTSGNYENFYAFDAYGSVSGAYESSMTDNAFGFAGQYFDPSGTYDMRARYYDPNTGEFTSTDPYLAQTDQAYGYAGYDPVNSSDPSGLCASSRGGFVNTNSGPNVIYNGPCPNPNSPNFVAQVQQAIAGIRSYYAAPSGFSQFIGGLGDAAEGFVGLRSTFCNANAGTLADLGTAESAVLAVAGGVGVALDTARAAQAAEDGSREALALEEASQAVSTSAEADDAGVSDSLVTIRHYTSDLGRTLIEKDGSLRPGTYVTLPSDIPAGTSSEGVEKLLEIEAGKGANYVDVPVASNLLGMPENGPFTSGGAWQRILIEPVDLAGLGFVP